MKPTAFFLNADLPAKDFLLLAGQLREELAQTNTETVLVPEDPLPTFAKDQHCVAFVFCQRRTHFQDAASKSGGPLQESFSVLGSLPQLHCVHLVDCSTESELPISRQPVLKQRLDAISSNLKTAAPCDVLTCDYATWNDPMDNHRLTINALMPLTETDLSAEILLVFYHNLRHLDHISNANHHTVDTPPTYDMMQRV